MSVKSLSNPFDPNTDLTHTSSCCGGSCNHTPQETAAINAAQVSSAAQASDPLLESDDIPDTPEKMLDRAVESAVVRAIFGGNDVARRRFMKVAGAGAALTAIKELFPLDDAKAMAQDAAKGKIEKPDLSVGFIPITCATPIIMAEPMGFYKKYGLNAKVKKAAGWAMVRDWAITKEVDAAHMLSPMPLSITLGAGSPKVPFLMPAVENINGQAITVANKHKGVKEPKDFKGFRFCVPFEYSMHNYLLRYWLAEGGVHPDKDVQIRVVPPPEMVANLKAGNVDAYLAPDPFNQRAVYENAGYIFKLSKEIWEGHPCCAFAASKEFATTYPNTFMALFKSIVEATHYASDKTNRKEIAKAIAPKNYLNQPQIVLEQVLTGKYVDGLGGIQNDPERIDFDPFPWHSMAVWILTQMKRWKHVETEFDYKQIAEEVYMAPECAKLTEEFGYADHPVTYEKHMIMGKEFDADKADEYLKSFKISNL